MMVSVRVPGFLPSQCGFHFNNSFPNVAHTNIPIAATVFGLGNAANGLCGGMVYTVRDLFEAHRPSPSDSTPPASGPLYDYMVKRLYDSFDLPGGPLTYLHFMDPALPDHETDMSKIGLAPHGRAWATIKEQWPTIKADLDNGRPSVLALVMVKTADPFRMGENHQVLAYGYDLNRGKLKILIYDPNFRDSDEQSLQFSISRPTRTTPMKIFSGATERGQFFALFRTTYIFNQPPNFDVPVLPPATLTIKNESSSSQDVRIFRADDVAMVFALPAGEFAIGVNRHATWVFPPTVSQVKIVANGRVIATAGPSAQIVIPEPPCVTVINQTSANKFVRAFNVNDVLMLAALPNGEFDIAAGATVRWSLPPGVTSVKLSANNRPIGTVSVGGSIAITQDDSALIRNLSNNRIDVKIYKSDDSFMFATLPGGSIGIQPHTDAAYILPSDVGRIKVIGGGTHMANRGEVILLGP